MSLNHLDPNPVGAPCVMVIFGASGDLTKRKLIPALCNLASDGLLSKQFAIVGFAANDYTTETFRKMLTDEIPKYSSFAHRSETLELVHRTHLLRKRRFSTIPRHTSASRNKSRKPIKSTTLSAINFSISPWPPDFSRPSPNSLGEAGLTKEEDGHWARVIVEKPFGHDLESAKQLNQDLKQVLTENQIYRIDHYLGKRNRSESDGLPFLQ